MDKHNPINSEPGILNLNHAQVFVYMLLAVVVAGGGYHLVFISNQRLCFSDEF
jgi:hypothetical protein